MTGYHINELAPHHRHHAPDEFAIGVLTDEATVESVAESLTAADISADRIYFMHGDEAVKLIKDATGLFARIFDQDLDKPLEALRQGRTLVGIAGVTRDDLEEVRTRIIDAGAVNRAYLGKWTTE